MAAAVTAVQGVRYNAEKSCVGKVLPPLSPTMMIAHLLLNPQPL